MGIEIWRPNHMYIPFHCSYSHVVRKYPNNSRCYLKQHQEVRWTLGEPQQELHQFSAGRLRESLRNRYHEGKFGSFDWVPQVCIHWNNACLIQLTVLVNFATQKVKDINIAVANWPIYTESSDVMASSLQKQHIKHPFSIKPCPCNHESP